MLIDEGRRRVRRAKAKGVRERGEKKKLKEVRRELAHLCFGCVPAPPKPANKVAKKKWAARMKGLYDRLDVDAEAVIEELKPPDTRIFTDHDCGRWRGTYRPTKEQKSAAWTKAGSRAAVCTLLKALWGFATEHDLSLVPPREVMEMEIE